MQSKFVCDRLKRTSGNQPSLRKFGSKTWSSTFESSKLSENLFLASGKSRLAVSHRPHSVIAKCKSDHPMIRVL